MKRILITGVNSYVGNKLEKWLKQYPDQYYINKISLKNTFWKREDFSNYDVIVHVAGIAHVTTNPKMKEEYYRVNRDLTINVATKAKDDGVKQFIFLSSIIVYGDKPTKTGIIDSHTIPKPSNFYGKSKLQAEEGIIPLNSTRFKVANIRPPMIYGKDSKGNYPKLSFFARNFPIFPNFENKRSMIYIENLCEFIRVLIDNEDRGLFFPQNKEYVKTSEMVRLIADVHNKKLIMTKLFNPFIRVLRDKVGILNKVFGDLIYDQQLSKYKVKYQNKNLRDSIKATEGK